MIALWATFGTALAVAVVILSGMDVTKYAAMLAGCVLVAVPLHQWTLNRERAELLALTQELRRALRR